MFSETTWSALRRVLSSDRLRENQAWRRAGYGAWQSACALGGYKGGPEDYIAMVMPWAAIKVHRAETAGLTDDEQEQAVKALQARQQRQRKRLARQAANLGGIANGNDD